MTEKIYLSIIIPAYKEEDRISIILDAVAKYQSTKDFSIEVIVVVDASPDQTAEVARSFETKIKNLIVIEGDVNKGKGGAVREGILASSGQYAIFSDADNATPIEQVDKLLKFVSEYQVIIGSRYCKGGRLAIPQPLQRRIGGRVLNFLIRHLAVPGIKDTQCGFKLFEHEAAMEIFKRQTILGWSFDIEILAIARKLGYKIREVGITWYDNPHSRVNPIKDGIKMIKDSWAVRKNILTGKYH